MSTSSSSVSICEILIAEDSPTQTLLLRNMLEKHGFRATWARNGRLALEALESRRPALIISDIQMPEMDGYELCEKVKQSASLRDIPVILLTSLSSPHDIISGLACGADNFVVKPYEEDFLLSRIATILASHELGRVVSADGGIPIHFAGEQFVIHADRWQILNLLLSTYETAVKTNLELIQTHEALKVAQGQLIEMEKLLSVGRLAAGVAHEVRNPLSIMEMGISFLSAHSFSEDGKMILGEMREAVSRASRVISGLTELSSPSEMGMKEESLNALIERALLALGDDFARAGIEVTQHLAPDLPPSLVDAPKIEQVFVNLFTNSLHAMPRGGRLILRSDVRTLGPDDVAFDAGERSGARFRVGERVVVVEVRDSGVGIPTENLPKLFDPFFSSKPTGKGMGLGLTVAKKIIDLHRGRIEIRDLEEGGALVTLTFKIA